MTGTDDLPAWAQRCSCGGQGITHLHAEHHEPIGPAVIDPFAGHACPLCGDHVIGPCPTCAPDAMAALARVRAELDAADRMLGTDGPTFQTAAGARILANRIRTALSPEPPTDARLGCDLGCDNGDPCPNCKDTP